MAKTNAVWGIDIGQCALKALRCKPDADGNTIVADKYDVVEYPKILSATDADPEELVAEAIQTFLSRNEVTGDKVAVSVAGQAGLSRFFKPPPVDVSTLPDIVKYEVKAQIPFAIEDVIWDWQQMGGTIVDGRTVDAEIGLFAMKRDAVFTALRPFDDAEIDVDFVQLSPISIFNVVCHDLIGEIPNADDIDPENPPPSTVVMSIGTDTTDLIVTNGIRMWLRNIPIGGNHFTKQLSREMKLTQAKAEHLKRNARASENPKAIFKAMRPVFTDFVNEVQRSLNFFQSNEKSAELSEILLLGNAAKLPGLRQYLSKQLEIEIGKVTEFSKLSGSDVTSQKSFQNNLLSFASCYGLCLQGLQKAQIKTNLLPREIVVKRIVEAKKPWVLTAVCSVMAGLAFGYLFTTSSWHKSEENFEDVNGVSWKTSMSDVKQADTISKGFIADDIEQKKTLDQLNALSKELTSASVQKAGWLEFQLALSQAFPKDQRIEDLKEEGKNKVDPHTIPFDDRKDMYVDHIESKFVKDIKKWQDFIKPFHEQMRIDLSIKNAKDPNAEPVATEEVADVAPVADGEKPTSGWVIEVKAHHFHNSTKSMQEVKAGKNYVLDTLIEELINKRDVKLPGYPDKNFTYADIGVSYPTISWVSDSIFSKKIIFDPSNSAAALIDGGRNKSGGFDEMDKKALEGIDENNIFDVRVYAFVVQMAWIPRTDEEILAAHTARLAAQAEKAAMEAEKASEDANEDN